MKTIVSLAIEHSKPIPDLAKLVEHRAYTIDGVSDANVMDAELGLSVTTPNDLPSVGKALPAPFGFLCEWAARGGFLAVQTVYYGEPGNGIDDDWNRHPEVHENLPIYTADQLRALVSERDELASRVAELTKQNEAQKNELLSWNEKRAALEANARRYECLRRGQHWSVIDGMGNVLRGDGLDAAVDAALNASKGTAMNHHLEKNCEGVDAAVFSGDVLYDDDSRAELKDYIARWTRAIAEHEGAALAAQPGAAWEWKHIPIEPTDDMLNEGAQRLVSWGEDSKWPDSWRDLQVKAAKNEAERVWRSMWLAAPTEAKPAQAAVDAEQIKKALNQAFVMGQNYWHDADSESYAANKRSDVTRQRFNEMRDELCAAISAKKGG